MMNFYMELYKTFSSKPESKKLLNVQFTYKDVNFKTFQIEKVWGDSPCFLAYIIAIGDNSTLQRFLGKCIANIYSQSDIDRWELSIHEYAE